MEKCYKMKSKNIILILLFTSLASAQAGWSDWGRSTIWSAKISDICDFGKALVNGTLTSSQKTNTKIAAGVAVGLVAV